jgi:pilus assembly protein Flp/PilA
LLLRDRDALIVLFNRETVREINMLRFQQLIVRFVKDRKGQDMVEYALLAGFVAVAAGALLPGISDSISTIFSRMASVVSVAAAA